MTRARRGSMDMGTPLLIMAVIGAIAVSNLWDALPLWLGVSVVVCICLLALGGVYYVFSGHQGMGANALRLSEQHETNKNNEDDEPEDQKNTGAP